MTWNPDAPPVVNPPCPLGGTCLFASGCETLCPPNIIPNANKAQVAAAAARLAELEEAA